MDTTSNYQLLKPTLSDPADITAFMSNFDTIDTALKDLDVNKAAHTNRVANADLNLLLSDGQYICAGTMKNTPIANTYCVLVVYDTSETNRIVQVCYVPQSNDTIRVFSRAATGLSFGAWREFATSLYVDTERNKLKVLIDENTFRNQSFTHAMNNQVLSLFIEVLKNTDDINTSTGDGASAIANYFNSELHIFTKNDDAIVTIYFNPKVVTNGNNYLWCFLDWEDISNGSVVLAISRDNGTNYTTVAHNTSVNISSKPAGVTMIAKLTLKGRLTLKNIAWGCR